MSSTGSKTPSFKVVLLGEGRVGKTSLILRFVRNLFSDAQESTIQATYLEKVVKIGEQKAHLSIWDTAGQERFHALGPIYYRNANGALLVYDVTDHDSFVKVKNWVKELRKVVGNDIHIVIAGNKCDLKQRQVDESEAIEYAKSVNATHFLTSAKANKGVEEVFMELTKKMLQKYSQEQEKDANEFTRRTSVRRTTSLRVDEDESTGSRIEGRVGGNKSSLRVVDGPTEKPAGGKCCG